MSKVKISKFIVLFTICFFVGSSVVPCISCLNNNGISDEIDQQQDKYDASTCLLGTMLFAQSFRPSLETLTRVELLMNKLGNLYGNSILSIRESLSGEDLTSVSKESLEIYSDMKWIEFDFPDITVRTGDIYYIVLKPDPDSDGGDEFNFIGWAFGVEDPYQNGDPFEYYNGLWSKGITGHSSADYTFKTYGYDNEPPTNPICTYDKSNKEITVSSTDLDGDQIRYGISWNNTQTVDEWTTYYDSGVAATIDCTDKEGTVGVIAEDTNGAQSGWVSVTSKDKSMNYPVFNSFLDRLFYCFPFFEKIINLYYN